MNRKRTNQSKSLDESTLAITPSKKIRWDTAKTASLIEHYQCHDYLWNPKAADYKNDEKRRKCIEHWLEINQLEKDLVHEVKIKLHGLRTSFGQQFKLEMANAQKQAVIPFVSNQQPPIVAESKWQWYRQLSFLKDAVTFRGAVVPKTDNEFEHTHSLSLSSTGEYSNHESEKNEIQKVLNDQAMHQYPTNFVTLDHTNNYQIDTLHSLPMATTIHVHDQIMHNAESNDINSYHTHSTTMSTPTPPSVKHITSIGSSQTNEFILSDNKRYSNNSNSSGMTQLNGCPNCLERQRDQPGEKLGRLVTETYNNLHPEYQDMARMEIHQLLGKYLQKPIPNSNILQ